MADSKPNIDISLESINGRYDKACEKSNAFHQWGENESPSKYTNCIMNLTYFLGLFSVCISIKIKRPLERRSVCVCWWIAKYFSCSSGSLISSINLSALKCRSSISRNQTKRIELRTLCAPHFQPFFDSADFAVWISKMKQEQHEKSACFQDSTSTWTSEVNKICMIYLRNVLSNTIELQSILMFQVETFNHICTSGCFSPSQIKKRVENLKSDFVMIWSISNVLFPLSIPFPC